MPGNGNGDSLDTAFESNRIQIAGLIVSEVCLKHNHWNAPRSLEQWLYEQRVPGLSGIDTRMLTKHLREKGSMLGKLLVPKQARFLPWRVNRERNHA